MKYSEAFSLLKDIQLFIRHERLILEVIDNVVGNKDLQLAMLQRAEDAKQKARRLANYILDEKDEGLAKKLINDHDYIIELEHLVKTDKFITAKVPMPLPEELTPYQRELYAMVKPFCVDKENMGVNIGLEFKACLFNIEDIMRDVEECLFSHDIDTTDTTGNDLLIDGTFGSDTQKAKNLFKRAVEAGLCKVSNGKYQWLGSKALLAYFAEEASLYLELGKGEYNGNPKTSWKPFEKIFSVKGLSNNRNDNKTKSNEPREYRKVDDLFR